MSFKISKKYIAISFSIILASISAGYSATPPLLDRNEENFMPLVHAPVIQEQEVQIFQGIPVIVNAINNTVHTAQQILTIIAPHENQNQPLLPLIALIHTHLGYDQPLNAQAELANNNYALAINILIQPLSAHAGLAANASLSLVLNTLLQQIQQN